MKRTFLLTNNRDQSATSNEKTKLTSQAVTTSAFAIWMLLPHVNLQRLLIFVMPIALRTLEGLAGVAR